MPRIAGVDIPDRKKILFSLQYVHGIGPKVAADQRMAKVIAGCEADTC